MPEAEQIYSCPQCHQGVRAPGHLGRSWCTHCEEYLIPVGYNPDEIESVGEDAVYDFTNWRPKAHQMAADENPDHKFSFTKRKNRLVKGGKGVSYLARCTCGKFKGPDFTTRRRAHTQWEGHMVEVRKQGELFDSLNY